MTRLGPLLSPILVGRDELLDQAEDLVSDVAAGRGRLLLLAGEAGIGKSRLISSIERKAQAAGFRVAGGLLAPQDRYVPGASLLDLARTMRRRPGFESLGSDLLQIAQDGFEAPTPRRRALVLRAVDAIAGSLGRPLVLSFDDLQWADELSLEIIAELARATRERPLLLVGAYRTDEVAPGSMLRQWRSRLIAQRLGVEARLAPLTLAQTAQMTTVILATGLPAPVDVAAAVYERTDGIPLHVEELLGALGDEERTDCRAIRDAAVPDTLEDAILQRVGRLSPEAQEVARSGAVIGRCFVPDVLAGIMNLPPAMLEAPLRELVDHDVLEPPGPRGLYDFRHQLLRDALYRSVPASSLRRLHARAAEFGRDLEGASEVHASVHYERAGMRNEAFHSAVAGARAAARINAHREAFDLYARAIDNMPADLPPADQAAILDAAISEAAAREELVAWRRWAELARERYLQAGDPAGAAEVLIGLMNAAGRDARPVEERYRMVADALVEVDGLPPGRRAAEMRAWMRFMEGHAAVSALDPDRARAAIDAARVAAADLDDPSFEHNLAMLEGRLAAATGHLEEGLELLERTARTARDAGLDEDGITAYRTAATVAVQVLDYRRSEVWIEEGLRYSDEIEQSYCAHIMAATGGLLAWAAGRWDEAVARGEQALSVRGSARGVGLARWPLGYVALGRGELAEARRHLAAGLAFAEDEGAPDGIIAGRWGLAEVALQGHQYQEAIDHTEAAIEVAGRTATLGQFAPVAVTGTRARLAAGRPAEAGRWIERAAALLGPVGWFASPAIEHARGLLALAEGSTGLARGCFERAVSGWEEKGRSWEALGARLDLAEALVRSGRFVDAAALLDDTRASALRLGSRPLVERADALARQARGRTAGEEPWHPLTARELEVARLIAAGGTNAQIALELGIAPKTASAHVEHILAKLGAARRAEIAAWVSAIPGGDRPPSGRAAVASASAWGS